ncbi:uncharacterized protein [Gossypium hirsutum]|uniref:Uncharacterized protein isoform X3 n=1 Tax=Gossypium hirsutum TaxID=3635 RepID=A0ABM3BCU4_GOSHI|nr:uncharacterized protein LOC107920551 isoform X3 [Gossypium hirsutum]
MAAISCFLRLRHSSPSSKVSGSFGEIYLGTNLQTNEEVAIKFNQRNQSWIGEKLKLSTNRPVSIFHYLRFKDQASSLRIVSKIITLSTLSVLKCFKF